MNGPRRPGELEAAIRAELGRRTELVVHLWPLNDDQQVTTFTLKPPIGCRVLAVIGLAPVQFRERYRGIITGGRGGPGLVSGIALSKPDRIAVRLGGRQGS
jgi:hypothetical protein